MSLTYILTSWLAPINKSWKQFHNVWTDAVWAAMNNYIYLYTVAAREGGNSENALTVCPAEESSEAELNLLQQCSSKLCCSHCCFSPWTAGKWKLWPYMLHDMSHRAVQTTGKRSNVCWLVCVCPSPECVSHVNVVQKTRISTLWCLFVPRFKETERVSWVQYIQKVWGAVFIERLSFSLITWLMHNSGSDFFC